MLLIAHADSCIVQNPRRMAGTPPTQLETARALPGDPLISPSAMPTAPPLDTISGTMGAGGSEASSPHGSLKEVGRRNTVDPVAPNFPLTRLVQSEERRGSEPPISRPRNSRPSTVESQQSSTAPSSASKGKKEAAEPSTAPAQAQPGPADKVDKAKQDDAMNKWRVSLSPENTFCSS